MDKQGTSADRKYKAKTNEMGKNINILRESGNNPPKLWSLSTLSITIWWKRIFKSKRRCVIVDKCTARAENFYLASLRN